MPEGDTIYRTALTLRTLLRGQKVVVSGMPAVAPAQPIVESVDPLGKHLLIRFSSGEVLHSHMGMTGSWHTYRHGEPWQKPRTQAKCELNTESSVAVCFTPKTIELLSKNEILRHPHLSRLGPDITSDEFDPAKAIERFRIHNATPIGEAVLDQTIVCGLGNVYKSEILFLENTHPLRSVGSLSDPALRSIIVRGRKLILRNLNGFQRTTRNSRQGGRVWVYRRSGNSCFRCGHKIMMQRQGDLGRSTYWCPSCQPD